MDKPRAPSQMATGAGKMLAAANIAYRLVKRNKRIESERFKRFGTTS